MKKRFAYVNMDNHKNGRYFDAEKREDERPGEMNILVAYGKILIHQLRVKKYKFLRIVLYQES